MKYVEKHIPTEGRAEIFFNKNAKRINPDTKEQSCSKVVVKNDRETYYIRVHQGVPYDPLHLYGKKIQDLETKMMQVSKETFDFYMIYLNTNNSIYITRARRGLFND